MAKTAEKPNPSADEAKQLLECKMHSIHLIYEDWERARDDYRLKLAVREPLPPPEVLATLA